MSCTFVIFGASGDLTKRKLIPALYRLYREQRLPGDTRIIGCSRSEFSDEQWREALTESTQEFCGDDFDADSWSSFAPSIGYEPLDIGDVSAFQRLAKRLDSEEANREESTRVYYLSTSPSLYSTAIKNLGAAGLAAETNGPRRIVIEKPFGVDLASAQQLNREVHEVFQEHQVYRIDHYLGKETVQNLLVLRFANGIFEPIWNRNYIDHIQITVAEEVAVGQRGGYYDKAGVLRDMFQNHLLQLMTIAAMESPGRYQADFVRDEKVRVLHSVRPMEGDEFRNHTLRAQYDGYLDEPGVPKESETASFAALKLYVDNWRWKGVPFYLRSGKAMSCRTTQIVVQFQEPPHSLFGTGRAAEIAGNRLVVQIQPAEGIQMHLQSKVPDSEMKIRMTELDFRFDRMFSGKMPDAYQNLLLDATEGDASLFARSDEVELAWRIIDPIMDAWQSGVGPTMETYPVGDWGPESATKWMEDQGRAWFDVCPILK